MQHPPIVEGWSGVVEWDGRFLLLCQTEEKAEIYPCLEYCALGIK